MIFQDPMTSLNPVHTIGRQLVEAILLHQDVTQGSGARPRARAAQGGRHPARRAADRRLPAPVLGRHAPARDDRDGARQQPRPADRRRADDGARRDHAGADPRPDEAPPEGVRQRDHHDHPRPRRRRRDRRRRRRHVRRASRRSRATCAELFKRPQPPVHLGPARLAAAPPPGRRAARADPRPAAVAALPAERLPLPPALLVRDAGLPGAEPRARAGARPRPSTGSAATSTRRRRTARRRRCSRARWRKRADGG